MTTAIWNAFHQELLGFIQSRVKDTATAEDILQDVFIKIHNSRSSVQDSQKMVSWMYQITRNTIIDHYRKQKHTTTTLDIELALPDELTEETIDFTKCLTPFIHQLPEHFQDVLTKTALENMSQKDYAAINDLSYSATKSRVQRARKALSDLFQECCAVEADTYGNIINANSDQCKNC